MTAIKLDGTRITLESDGQTEETGLPHTLYLVHSMLTAPDVGRSVCWITPGIS